MAAVAQELGDLKRIDKVDLAGSRWKLVFTESTASSSGKIGPFVGRTEQVQTPVKICLVKQTSK